MAPIFAAGAFATEFMNMALPWIIGASSIADTTTNTVNSAFNLLETREEVERKKAQYNLTTPEWQWRKQQLQLERDREDNAIQRRVKDMQLAGLNPVLSAGNGASSSVSASSVSPSAVPSASKYEKMQSMLAIAQAVQQAQATKAQIALTKAEEKSRNLDNEIKPIVAAKELVNLDNAKKDGVYKDLQNISQSLDNQYKNWDYGKSYKTGISKDTHPIVKAVRDASQIIKNNADLLVKGAQNVGKKSKTFLSNVWYDMQNNW